MTTTTNDTISNQLIPFSTIVFALLGLVVPKMLLEGALPIFGFTLILTGVPHGAVDYFLFKQLRQQEGGNFSAIRFFGGYLLLIAAYIVVWNFAPTIAFLLFILVSAYHFGQSNWVSVRFSTNTLEKIVMSFCFILGKHLLLFTK